MGYFASIIKDSRLNLSARRSQASSYLALNGQSAPELTVTARSVTGNRLRDDVAGRSPDAADTSLAPNVVASTESHEVTAENVNLPGPQTGGGQHVKKTHAIRSHRLPGDEHTGPDGPIDSTDEPKARSTDEPKARPLIQRKATATPASRASAATIAGMSAVPQPGGQSRNRPASQSERPSPQSAGGGIPHPARKHPTRIALPEGDRRPAAETIISGALPVEQQLVPGGESDPTPTAKPNHRAAAAGPIEATLKSRFTKPPLPAASTTTVHQTGNSRNAPAGHDNSPRVQIGQVNVIVEDSQVPTQSSSSPPRGRDLASRTFLRSL